MRPLPQTIPTNQLCEEALARMQEVAGIIQNVQLQSPRTDVSVAVFRGLECDLLNTVDRIRVLQTNVWTSE